MKQYNAESLEHFFTSNQLGFLTVTKHKDPVATGFWLSIEVRPNWLSTMKADVATVTEKDIFFGTNKSIPVLEVPKGEEKYKQ